MVAALENLITNAIETNIALTDPEKRYLHVLLYADMTDNSVSITNPVENYTGNVDDYFRSGYSSKDPLSHKGLGLTSALATMAENGISLSAKYDETVSAITFTVRYSHQGASKK